MNSTDPAFYSKHDDEGAAPSHLRTRAPLAVPQRRASGDINPPLVVDIAEAGRLLGGLSRAQLYRLIESGAIESCHIGRLLRISRRSVERYVTERLNAEGRLVSDTIEEGVS